jgi:4-hydroxythreonine-4-phosphate dehydrogenase
MSTLRIAITPGEPAGIGPDLVLQLAAEPAPVQRVIIADPQLLRERAQLLGLEVGLRTIDPTQTPEPDPAGTLSVLPCSLAAPCQPGRLDPRNAEYVLETLRRACQGCLDGDFDAMVTAPVQKSVIGDAGFTFSGHTEFLAAETGAEQVVMLLVCDRMRVALATTHIPLSEVPGAITEPGLIRLITLLDSALRERFGIPHPRITVLGLNPHAGESGHLGREEIEIITPALDRLRQQGLQLIGPLPADTAFTPAALEGCDAVLAMYHDQGLPVLKYAGFGSAVNVTLGLPIIRTSVDHGTALDLAGSGNADAGSLRSALQLAAVLSGRRVSNAGRVTAP